jgi:hypothetical protein
VQRGARFFQKWADHRPMHRSGISAAASALGIAALGTSTAVAPSSASSPTQPVSDPGHGCDPWVLFALFVAILVATLLVGLVILFWTAWRADRQRALPA